MMLLLKAVNCSYLILFLVFLSNNETSVFAHFASPICAVDLCNNQTSSCTPVGSFQYFTTSFGKFFFPYMISTKLEPDPLGLPTPTCTGDPTCNTFCRSSPCSGTQSYCSNNSCVPQSSCFCDIGFASTNTYVTVEQGEFAVLSQDFTTVYWCPQQYSKKRSIQTDISSNCTLYTIDSFPILSFKSIPDINGFIKATYQGETKVIPYSHGASMSVPDSWTHSTGNILFEVVSSSAYCTSSYSLVAKTTCTVTDCIMCSEFWSNWQCIPSSYRSVIVWFSVIMILLLICMLPWVGWIAYVALSLILNLLYYLFRFSKSLRQTKVAKKAYNHWKYKSDQLKDMFKVEDPSSEELDVEAEVEQPTTKITPPKANGRRIKRFVNGIPIFAVLCLCCVVNVQVVDSCTSGLSVSSTSNLCSSNGTSQQCTTAFDLVGSVSSIGEKFCFTLNSPTGDTWTGMIQHIGSMASVSLNSLYYTSPWSGVSQSAHWCDGTAKCSGGCSGACTSRTCNGALSNSQLSLYPGISTCHSSCGCVTCSNCFLCTPSCLYSGFAIVPSGPAYQVFSPGTITFEPSVWVTITGPGVSVNRAVSLSQNAITVGNFTMRLNGAFQGSQISFGSNSLICDTTSPACYFTPAASVNQLTSGIPGDIQGSTLASLTTPNQNFRIGSIYTISQGNLGDTYIFQNSGVTSTINTWLALPATVDGNIFTGNSSIIRTNLTAPPPILFSMTTPSGLTYTRNQNIVCPSFVITNASGCYSCTAGSVVTITARSTCSSGTVSVTSNVDLVTTSLSLTTTNNVFNVYIKPTTSPVQLLLTLSSPLATATQSFTFSPVFVSNVVNQTYNVNNGTSSTTSDSSSVSDFFTGLGEDIAAFSTSTEGIVFWVLLGVLILSSLVLLYLVPKYKSKTK